MKVLSKVALSKDEEMFLLACHGEYESCCMVLGSKNLLKLNRAQVGNWTELEMRNIIDSLVRKDLVHIKKETAGANSANFLHFHKDKFKYAE